MHTVHSHDAIVVEDLGKRYRDGTEAVRGISFRVRTGEIFGLLGPNGAGKSTTVGMLGTLVRPTAGRATVAGFDVVQAAKDVRRRIGFAMQDVGVDELATGSEFLVLHARLHGLSRREAQRPAGALIELVGLSEVAGRRMADYSGGMKRRVDLASALIHEPSIVFLDEPTEGLDPHARATIWATLERLNDERGITIVLTTHYMDEADRLCGRIAIIDDGRIVAQGTPDQLKGAPGVSLEDAYLRYTGRSFEEAA
jgi:ABC-2 type transport system ATP-binding protein